VVADRHAAILNLVVIYNVTPCRFNLGGASTSATPVSA
jgi:hypothetical protein